MANSVFNINDFDLGFNVDDDMLSAALELPEETHYADLLPNKVTHQKLYPWPPRLPLDLALEPSAESDILSRHGVTEDQYETLKLSEPFRRELAEAQKFIREEGFTFKKKCQAIAEDWLPELDSYLHAPLVMFKDKLDAFKTITKLGNLEPQGAKDGGNTLGAMVQININL